MEKPLRFVWFWTFWHWSRENSRTGRVACDPWLGIGANWAEWLQGEASDEDRLAISETSETRSGQSQFIHWLFRHWAPQADPSGNRVMPRFVLGQLVRCAPFGTWESLVRYRTTYGALGFNAVILAEESAGEGTDVRSIESLLLPRDVPEPKGQITSEGFTTEAKELHTPHQLTRGILAGKPLGVLFAWWVVAGRRPYGLRARILLNLGWGAEAGLLLSLLFGPDPGEQLPLQCGLLLAGWLLLSAAGVVMAAAQGLHLWRAGREWSLRLLKGQTRLRMNDGLTIKGESAGLPFTLNTLLAVYRAHPAVARRSWIWRRVLQAMDREGTAWAATGIVTAGGWIKPVVIAPKLRACFERAEVKNVLVPMQSPAVGGAAAGIAGAGKVETSKHEGELATRPHLGFAAEQSSFRLHRCRHIAEALMKFGRVGSGWQVAANLFALVVSMVVLAALPNLRSILWPAPPPNATGPSSSSAYFLWVTLDTPRPDDFQVVLESRFWINRRVNVLAHGGAQASNRAEIRLLRVAHPLTNNPEDGTVWVERRRTFLTREYAPGERVGQYSVSYLNRIGHE